MDIVIDLNEDMPLEKAKALETALHEMIDESEFKGCYFQIELNYDWRKDKTFQ